jgi:S-adenosylmethionine hydrolase
LINGSELSTLLEVVLKKSLLFLTILIFISCAPKLQTTPKTVWFPVKVVRVSEEYANINTDLTLPDLEKHGITHGSRFNVRFKDHTMQALLGKKYSDVPKKDWVALIEEDGTLQIAISYGHAATEISCKKGDILYIESIVQMN